MSKFEQACAECFEEWEASLPDIESLPDPQYSKKHNYKMKKLFDQMRGDKYHYFTRKAVKVMIIAAVIFALMLCAFAIPSSRKYIIDRFDGFGIFTISQHNHNAVNGIDVGYIPEGFELKVTDEHDKIIEQIYENAESVSLSISKRASNVYALFNTVDSESKEVTIDNVTYSIVVNSSARSYIMWSESDYIYCVDGTLPREELLKIAQNLK